MEKEADRHALHFTIVPPPQVLTRDIECIRLTTFSGNEFLDVKTCPKGFRGIVFQLAEDGTTAIESITIRSNQISDIPILFLHGQGSEPSVMRFKGKPYLSYQVVLKPHAIYSLFGWNVLTLHHGFLHPAQFDATVLESQLLSASTHEDRIALLFDFLMKKVKQTNRRDELIEQILDFIRDHVTSISVKDIVAIFHISERQFQKRFARVVGMPPQFYIRMMRVNAALQLMKTGNFERLSDIAYALNYFDQSHFIRDIKRFNLLSPKSITMKVSEFHSDEAGSSYLL